MPPKIEAPRPGHRRLWIECRRCLRLSYYDYVPFSFSKPVMVMPCKHDPRQVNFLAEEIAMQKIGMAPA